MREQPIIKEPCIKDQLIAAQKEYINILTAELTELTGLAYTHGYKSKRIKQGKALRQLIRTIRKRIDND